MNATTVRYSVLHNGKPITFPGAPENNTGIPFLWRLYALADIPEPMLIAGSQSLYLITEKNGRPVVEPLLQLVISTAWTNWKPCRAAGSC